ncbi:MAG: ArsR family transcriptional regulator, partial [Candidatus Nitrosotenuis sp.]|nr:ArsR family transcriptional regulator [Candidatus Nitrosotenuis sp.]
MQTQVQPGSQKQTFSMFSELERKSNLQKAFFIVKKDDVSITIRINDTELTDKIIDVYLDKDSRIILYNLRSPMTITEIVKKSKLP